MADLVLFGTGSMADVVRVYIEQHSEHRIVGFTVDAAYRKSDHFGAYPVFEWENLEQHFPPDSVMLLGPLTPTHMNSLRRDRFHDGLARGYSFASFIHPSNMNYAEKIGSNCVILEGNILEPASVVGDNVIIWSSNVIGHHVMIGDHCFLSSQNGIAGNASIGAECFIGSQTGIGPGVKIGARSVVVNGAGTDRDLPEESVLIGHVGLRGELHPYKSSRIAHLL